MGCSPAYAYGYGKYFVCVTCTQAAGSASAAATTRASPIIHVSPTRSADACAREKRQERHCAIVAVAGGMPYLQMRTVQQCSAYVSLRRSTSVLPQNVRERNSNVWVTWDRSFVAEWVVEGTPHRSQLLSSGDWGRCALHPACTHLQVECVYFYTPS